MHEEFGFQTRRLTVLKAHEEDTKVMCRIYLSQQDVPKVISEEKLKQCMKEAEDDFYQDVSFLIKDKAKKVIGLAETKSEDRKTVEIGIWIPNRAKRTTYLTELIDSMIEWCRDYECYETISKIQLIDRIGPFGAIYSELKGKINLKSAS